MGIMDQMAADRRLENLPDLNRLNGKGKGTGEKGYPAGPAELDEKGRWAFSWKGRFAIARAGIFNNEDGTTNFSLNLVATDGPGEGDRFRVGYRFDPKVMADPEGFVPKLQRGSLEDLIKFAKGNDLLPKDVDWDNWSTAVDDVTQALAEAFATEGWEIAAGAKASCYTKDGEMKGPYVELSYIKPKAVTAPDQSL